MKVITLIFLLLQYSIFAFTQNNKPGVSEIGLFKNHWTNPPSHIPNDVSIDAPLMGNGDVTMSLGYKGDCLRYYLSKNDFWRLRSQGNGFSGPKVVGLVDIKIEGFDDAGFTAEQLISNGVTPCALNKNSQQVETKSWVSATENLVFIEIRAIDKAAKVSINLSAPENKQARLSIGKANDINWPTRDFTDSVEIPTCVAAALKIINYTNNTIVLQPEKKILHSLVVESKFKNKEPLGYVLGRIIKINKNSVATIMQHCPAFTCKPIKKSCMCSIMLRPTSSGRMQREL